MFLALHAWSLCTFFPHFVGWKKRLQGQSKGFILLHTHISVQALWPGLTSSRWHLPMCTCASFSQFSIHSFSYISFKNQHKIIVDICVLIRALHLLLLMFCLCEMCACWRKTMSATMIRWRGITTQMQRVYQLKHLVPSECEWAVDLSVTPLQRSFREMNGANAQRGADTARLTDFYHRKWNLFRYL